MSSSTTTVRIENKLKNEAVAILDAIGLTLTSSITMFLKAVVREKGLPLQLKLEDSGSLSAPKNNLRLNQAFLLKKDEFFTLYEDVEKELQHYSTVMRGKAVFCNCDDPFESAFFKYFLINFDRLGLKSLTSTCYSSSSLSGREYPVTDNCAYKAVVTRLPENALMRPDGSLDLESVFKLEGNKLERLLGDGDFRSKECVDILVGSDLIVTNPPFSLFREFIGLLEKYKKKYIVLGNMNAATCKELFPLFGDNKLWYGKSIRSGDRKFFVPDDYPLKAANCGVDCNGRRFIRVKGVRWFTNVESGEYVPPLNLNSTYDPLTYPKYDNYDAIEVGKTSNIPRDFEGVMGVPITFLDKYCPEQFEIIMLANGNARTNVSPDVLARVRYKAHPEDRGGVGVVAGERKYARILIKRKK